jgi:hypothetical protein
VGFGCSGPVPEESAVKNERKITVLLLVIGLGFALLGQFYFAYRREFEWDGLFIWSIAVCSLGLVMQRIRRGQGLSRRWYYIPWRSSRWPRIVAMVGGVSLVLIAGWIARRPGTVDFVGILCLWLAGVTWFLSSFLPLGSSLPGRGQWYPRLMSWFYGRRQDLLGLAMLLLVALLARAVDLEHIPANLGGDEGTQGMAALALLGPPLANPFATGWFSVPTMSFFAYGISIRVFGDTIAGLRALSALAGTVTILTTFLLTKELWGRRVAWLAAIVLTSSHFHIHFSRLGSNQIFDGLFITLFLWLFVRALRSRRMIDFALAGATIGLGWYGYFGARLVGLVVACYLAWRAVVEYRFLARHRWHLLALLGSALVTVAPLVFHFAENPHELVSRVRQVSIFASGWLLREQQITGRSAASLLIQQFWRSVSAFNYTLDPTFWYHASIPLLDLLSGILFVLGMMWVVVRRRWPGNGLLLLWFWLAVILGWVVTENPPSSMRLTIIAPALAILVSLGLDWLLASSRLLFGSVTIVESVPRQRFDLWSWVGGLLIAAIAVINLYYYFLIYTPTRVYGNPNAEVATELGCQLVEEAGDRLVYFYGPPFMYWEFGTLAFLARGVEGMNVPSLGDGEMPAVDLKRGACFVFLPERLAELDAVHEQYPGGEQMSVYSKADARLLYVLYKLDDW